MLSLTSTSTSDARSMFEYDLTASTSPEMRQYAGECDVRHGGFYSFEPDRVEPRAREYRGNLEAGFQFAVLQPVRYLVFEVAPPKWVEGGGRGGSHYSLPLESGESFELFGGQCGPQLHR